MIVVGAQPHASLFFTRHRVSVSRRGYFIEPTIVQSKDPKEKLMTEEIFGPVLTVYVYKDSDLDETMKLVETSTPYALTGAIFAQDE